jgi:transposase InsO family protein
MRALLIHRIRRLKWPVLASAAAAGISVRTAHKWLARYRIEGRRGLGDRSSAPHRRPQRTSEVMRTRIVAERYARRTAWAIAVRLQVPRSTVAAILAQYGLNRLARLTPPPPIRRYEHRYPGSLLHLDIKPLGRIERIGHRIHGDQGRRVKGAGYEYAHVAIDDHSRVAYVEVLADQRGPNTAAFFDRAVRWFAQRAVRIRRVLTDNGAGYRSHRFAAVARRAQIAHRWCRPYRPQTNGKAERFIQTLQREWAYAHPYATSARRTRALGPWLRYYNTRRPHTALDYHPPCARLPRAAQ